MRKQGMKMSQTNLGDIAIKSNDSMAEEMSEREFRMYIIKMIRKANDEMKEQMQAQNDKMKEQMQALNNEMKEQMQALNNEMKEQMQILNDHTN